MPERIDKPRGFCTRCKMRVKMLDSDRCEDCWAEDQQKYGGGSQAVRMDRSPRCDADDEDLD